MTLTIYHNPKCSKSRRTLQLIREAGRTPVIVDYVDKPPTPDELRRICGMLGIGPRELLRTSEHAYTECGLADQSVSDDALLIAMHENPILIQRPIVVAGKRACIGRPPEAVLELLKRKGD